MITLEEFQSKYTFSPENAFRIGMEREFFIVDQNGKIVPRAVEVYSRLEELYPGAFSYELSACQIESRVGPVLPQLLLLRLHQSEARLDQVLRSLKLRKLYIEVAPDDMPLDVYPDPFGRYAEIARNMSHERLLSACRIVGTHVHIGMPDFATALRVYNKAIKHCNELCTLGDGSVGERLRIYRQVAPKCNPKPYHGWKHFYACALKGGYAKDPRNCWLLIRITAFGTIEFRVFGVSDSIRQVADWGLWCRNLCMRAAQN